MPEHHEQRFLPYTPQQMFDLVVAVERYPEFLPWCRAVRVVERGEGHFVAEMVVAFHHLSERYTSRVSFDAPHRLDVSLVSGPFKFLENHWRFEAEAGGCRVDFSLRFEFQSRLLAGLMGGVFEKAQAKMMEAFIARSAKLYSHCE